VLLGDARDRIEHRAQVILHRLLGAGRILAADGADDVAMLAIDHLQPALVFERQIAHAIELSLHRGDEIPGVRMSGDGEDLRVHLFVEFEEAGAVALTDGLFLARELLTQGLDLRLGRALGGEANRAAFERLADELAAGDGGQLDRRDERADLRHDREQILLCEPLDDLADGGAADAMLLGEPGF